MELKFPYALVVPGCHFLLIEPYGIEIRNWLNLSSLHTRLLIEPYGIEISMSSRQTASGLSLLIEPYGIEIEDNTI